MLGSMMKKNESDKNRIFPIRSQLLLNSMNGKHATAVGIVYELDEDIDSKCMESAYLTAMKRFPYFNVKPKIENGSLYREWVEEPLPLQHDTEDYLINEADNLGYLYRVSVNGRKLSVQFFHGLADAAGIQNLVKLMLSFYYAQKGEAVSGVKDLFDLNEPVAYSEYMDPLDLEVFKDIEGMPFNQGEFFRLPEKNEKTLVTHSFSCDGESLMKYVKSIDGTPNVITAVLLSECIAKMYPESANKKIRSAIAVNGKNFFGPERNHTPFLSVSFFDFDEKRLHMNRETLHTCVRGTIFKDCFGDILISKFSGGKKLGEMFSMMPSPEAKNNWQTV